MAIFYKKVEKMNKENRYSGAKKAMKLAFVAAILLMISANGKVLSENSNDRIYINNNKEFEVDGKRIWINGVNTPWNKWNDFGGAYDNSWWDNEFARLHKAGINATRIWINCNNDQGAVTIDETGFVSGVSEQHWADLESLFELAKTHKVYIMATLTSFDHFKSSQWSRWQAMIKSKPASQSFADNYTIHFLNKFKDNPYLWSIDLMNEPDWVYENSECGNIPWNNISYFFAVNAAAIHDNSEVLVTVGLSYPKWNSNNYEGNKVSDTYLKSLSGLSNAYLDFWSPHYYNWVGEWFGVPHYLKPSGNLQGNNTGWSGGWGLDPSKPALIGECSAKGTGRNRWGVKNNTIITDFEQAYLNGWQGVMPWTSNGVDGEGSLANMSSATQNMLTKYPQLIFPADFSSSGKPQSANTLRAWIHNGNLHITGLIAGETLSVYNTMGMPVYQKVVTSYEADIPLSTQGMYIIHHDNRIVKVVVN